MFFFGLFAFLLIEIVTGELSLHADEKLWNLNCTRTVVLYYSEEVLTLQVVHGT